MKHTRNDASKEDGLEKTKYMLMPCHQNAGQNDDIKIDNIFFECGKVQVFGSNNNKSKIYS
jgi:hypothetical protein